MITTKYETGAKISGDYIKHFHLVHLSKLLYAPAYNLLLTYIVLLPGRNPTGRFFATNP